MELDSFNKTNNFVPNHCAMDISIANNTNIQMFKMSFRIDGWKTFTTIFQFADSFTFVETENRLNYFVSC